MIYFLPTAVYSHSEVVEEAKEGQRNCFLGTEVMEPQLIWG